MKKSIKLFLTFVGICLSAIMPCQLFAHDANQVNSRTEFSLDIPHADVSKIKYFSTEDNSEFILIGGTGGGVNRWIRSRPDGLIVEYQEISRDEWSIYLKQMSSGKEFKMDFHLNAEAVKDGEQVISKITSRRDQYCN